MIDPAPRDLSPARQVRSRQTAAALLRATLELLSSEGLEACTIPAVAARAGVAVGTVYRRYGSKDGLLKAAFLSLYNPAAANPEVGFGHVIDSSTDLAECMAGLIDFIIAGAFHNAAFIVSARQFIQYSDDADFKLAIKHRRLQAQNDIVDAIMARYGAGVRGGRVALELSLLTITGAVELAIVQTESPMIEQMGLNDFARALAAMQLAYLGS